MRLHGVRPTNVHARQKRATDVALSELCEAGMASERGRKSAERAGAQFEARVQRPSGPE
jgi:hypothetical protein